jgi:hypothetical protein
MSFTSIYNPLLFDDWWGWGLRGIRLDPLESSSKCASALLFRLTPQEDRGANFVTAILSAKHSSVASLCCAFLQPEQNTKKQREGGKHSGAIDVMKTSYVMT